MDFEMKAHIKTIATIFLMLIVITLTYLKVYQYTKAHVLATLLLLGGMLMLAAVIYLFIILYWFLYDFFDKDL